MPKGQHAQRTVRCSGQRTAKQRAHTRSQAQYTLALMRAQRHAEAHPQPTTSWWLHAPREGWGQAVQAQADRLRASKEGHAIRLRDVGEAQG